MAWVDAVVVFGVAAPSIILHEVSHGWAALQLGDDTAKRAGRLTLNPIRHIDPIGTIVLPAILALSGLGVIGYAKPVPVNLRRLRRPRDHAVVVAMAGPATNILIALICALLVRATGGLADDFDQGDAWTLNIVLAVAGVINLLLAFFNLLPIPPLDGSALLERLIPIRHLRAWYRIRPYTVIVVIGAVLLFGVGEFVIEPAITVFETVAGRG